MERWNEFLELKKEGIPDEGKLCFFYSKMTQLFIFLMSFVVSAQSEKINLANILVDANVLKA
ncbi:hypothetical protein ABEI22_13180 [Erwinia billingiae]|uniref:hypothetical protein n=1 Tax=Erwinia billingiae TaxID=182337 RepID=UPI00320BAD34